MKGCEHTDTLTCIVCPNSCRITVTYDRETKHISTLEGALCKRGERWAEQELFNPQRTVCSSVAVSGGTEPLASVRTTAAIPRERIPELMELLKTISLEAPVRIGQLVIERPLGYSCSIIITRAVSRA